jgi:MFS family permease
LTTAGTFASLREVSYRRYWTGQLVSQLGTWMRLIAVSWLVLSDLGGGGTQVGLLAAAQFTPTLLLGAFAGVLSDRKDPLRILRATQVAMIAVDAALAAFVLTGAVQLWMVFCLVGAGGLVTAFDNPARQALVGELVPDELVPNAVALSSMGFNGARIVGPAIAGLLLELGGPATCFVVDAVSYVGALVALLLIDAATLRPRDRAPRAKGQIREGYRYAMGIPVLRSTLVAMVAVGTLSMNFTVLVPLLAKSFTTTAGTFGLLSTAMGVGSLAGSVVAARRSDPQLRSLALAAFGLAGAMAAVAASPHLVVAMVAIAVTGACVIAYTSMTNSILQLNARPDMRGRVVALYLVLFVGTSPVGSPITGWVAAQHGVRSSVLLGSVGALAGALTLVLGGARRPTAVDAVAGSAGSAEGGATPAPAPAG